MEKDQDGSVRLRGGKDVQVLGQGRPIWDVEAALEALAGLSALLLVELLVAREVRLIYRFDPPDGRDGEEDSVVDAIPNSEGFLRHQTA